MTISQYSASRTYHPISFTHIKSNQSTYKLYCQAETQNHKIMIEQLDSELLQKHKQQQST